MPTRIYSFKPINYEYAGVCAGDCLDPIHPNEVGIHINGEVSSLKYCANLC